jgi:prefoldin beta subunit
MRPLGPSMADEIPQKVQEQLEQLQRLQNQLAVAQQQRQQMEMQVREAERAIEELGSVADDAPVYRSVGSVLFRTSGKADTIAKLGEEKESLEVRLKSMEKQEARVKEAATQLQSQVRAALKNVPGFGGSR